MSVFQQNETASLEGIGRRLEGLLLPEHFEEGILRKWEGRYHATWKREFKIPWRKAGLLKHLDDVVYSDQ